MDKAEKCDNCGYLKIIVIQKNTYDPINISKNFGTLKFCSKKCYKDFNVPRVFKVIQDKKKISPDMEKLGEVEYSIFACNKLEAAKIAQDRFFQEYGEEFGLGAWRIKKNNLSRL